MISATHPDEIPVDACAGVAAAVLWKSTLKPGLLDDMWLEHDVRSSR